MLLYSLLAERMLCSVTATSSILEPEGERGEGEGRERGERERWVQEGKTVNSAHSPSAVVAFWCWYSKAANSSSSDGLIILSRYLKSDSIATSKTKMKEGLLKTKCSSKHYILFKMLNEGKCWHLSSLKSVESCFDRCWPKMNTISLFYLSLSLPPSSVVMFMFFIPEQTHIV